MTAKHTPGPWITKPRKDGLVNIYHAGGVTDVALCVRPKDAALIAAAPALLAALEGCVAYIFDEFDGDESIPADTDRVLQKARAAIAAAKGEADR